MPGNPSNDIFLVVWMVTYNHENYLPEAIESVLAQETNFNFKLFIGEDNSKDNTRNICLQYKEKYPQKIELFLHNPNIGTAPNGIFMYQRCFESKAKYIALLEGDDYWSNPHKLQQQVNFLESNPSYSFCGHSFDIFDEQTKKTIETRKVKNNPIRLKDCLLGTPFHTSSMVFRNGFGFPKNFATAGVGDFHMQCHLASKGLGHGFSESMSVYRISNIGIWAKESEINQYFTTLRLQLWAIQSYHKHLFAQTKRIKELVSHLKNNNHSFKEKLSKSELWYLALSNLLFDFFLFNQRIKEKAVLIVKNITQNKSAFFY